MMLSVPRDDTPASTLPAGTAGRAAYMEAAWQVCPPFVCRQRRQGAGGLGGMLPL